MVAAVSSAECQAWYAFLIGTVDVVLRHDQHVERFILGQLDQRAFWKSENYSVHSFTIED